MGSSILDVKYKHSGYQYDNVFYTFDNKVDYTLAYWFVDLEKTKSNIDTFLTNPLIKFITEQLSYWNTNKCKEKLSLIQRSIPDNK